MTKIVYGAPVLEFVEHKYKNKIQPPYAAMGIEKHGKIVAGAVFNNYATAWDIELTLAAERGAITRSFLRAMGEYVRDDNGCSRVSIATEKVEVMGLAVRLGAEPEGFKKVGPKKYKFFFAITKENWKF